MVQIYTKMIIHEDALFWRYEVNTDDGGGDNDKDDR